MGQTALLPLRRKACWGLFRLEKSNGFGRVWTRELGYQSCCWLVLLCELFNECTDMNNIKVCIIFHDTVNIVWHYRYRLHFVLILANCTPWSLSVFAKTRWSNVLLLNLSDVVHLLVWWKKIYCSDCLYYLARAMEGKTSNFHIVGTVYHLVLYMQSNKIHKVFKDRVYPSHMLARQVSDLTGPSSGAFFLQAVCADLVCANTRTSSRNDRT